MFSGITQGLFPVVSLKKHEKLIHYTVALNETLIEGLKPGASVAIDGVCQTVVAIDELNVSFDAMCETLTKTTLSELFITRKVSVERSLCWGNEIGGHEVSGHIAEKAIIVARQTTRNNLCLTIQCSRYCFSFIKPKGFIALDGSSLTVGTLDKVHRNFTVYLIPETLRTTNFANKSIGDYVNLEPDMKTVILVETAHDYFSKLQDKLQKIEKELAHLRKHVIK